MSGRVTVIIRAIGAQGQGVAAGGTLGQALVKSSDADYATAWANVGGGGGGQNESIMLVVSGEQEILTTGAAKFTMRFPYGFILTGARASLNTASSAGDVQFDVLENGVSLFSTKIIVPQGAKSSFGGATQPVIVDSVIANDSEVTVNIDAAGVGAAGGKVYLLGYQGSP